MANAGRASGLSRRAVIAGGLLLPGIVSQTRAGVAQPLQTHLPPGAAPKPKGPLVFLDYDQEELDASYEQALWAPNQADLNKRNAQKTAAAVARLGAPRRLRYGPTANERLDLFATRTPNAPVHVFVHGGAWRAGSAAAFHYQSEMFVDAGAHFIAVDFDNVLESLGNPYGLVGRAILTQMGLRPAA